jgi:hypothetical protein
VRWIPPNTSPPGAKTGHSNPNCYLRAAGDCSDDISREHYISRDVLAELGPTITIHGLPWLAPDERRVVGIESLTAKILCRRHNSALAPLDAEAGRFFRALREIDENLYEKSLSRKGLSFEFCGLALDMWMVKASCGLFYSRIAIEGESRLVDTHTINDGLVSQALLGGAFLPGAGLYLISPRGSVMTTAPQLQFRQLTVEAEKRFVGFRIGVRNHEFDSLLDVLGVTLPSDRDGFHHRPSELLFKNKLREHRISLVWPPDTPRRSITMTVLSMQKRSA